MSQSIYEISNWSASTIYNLNDIVLRNNLYYYCTIPHTSTSSFDAVKFGGILINNGEQKSHFIWKPSYRFSVQNKPKVKKITFGDNYSQRLKDGISNNLPIIGLNFDNLNLDENTAILHFLNQRGGDESFLFLPEAPLGTLGRFICEDYTHTQNFYNNYSIQATFEQVVT